MKSKNPKLLVYEVLHLAEAGFEGALARLH
jgi:hypothetical protein